MPIFHPLERIAGQKTAKGIEPIISKALKYFFDQEMKDQHCMAAVALFFSMINLAGFENLRGLLFLIHPYIIYFHPIWKFSII